MRPKRDELCVTCVIRLCYRVCMVPHSHAFILEASLPGANYQVVEEAFVFCKTPGCVSYTDQVTTGFTDSGRRTNKR